MLAHLFHLWRLYFCLLPTFWVSFLRKQESKKGWRWIPATFFRRRKLRGNDRGGWPGQAYQESIFGRMLLLFIEAHILGWWVSFHFTHPTFALIRSP